MYISCIFQVGPDHVYFMYISGRRDKRPLDAHVAVSVAGGGVVWEDGGWGHTKGPRSARRARRANWCGATYMEVGGYGAPTVTPQMYHLVS